MKTLLSSSNSKLGDHIPAFNLPVLKTCPGKTRLCKVYCYARRHHFIMKAIKNKLEYNYIHSKSESFVHRIISEINMFRYYSESKGKKLYRIRLHSSGDFYSQAYLDKWGEIARTFPDIVMTAYTRSYMLDFSKVPKNLNLYYSMDSSTVNFSPHIKKQAQVILKKELPLYKSPDNQICNSKCRICNKCYSLTTDKNMLFLKH